MAWFISDWHSHYKRLFEDKNPVLWGLIVILLGLAATNYVLEDQQSTQSTVAAIKALGGIKK